MFAATTQEHQISLNSLKENYDAQSDQFILSDQRITLKFISTELLNLKKFAENPKIVFADKLFVEKYKLKLLKTFCDMINDKYLIEDVSPIIPKVQKESKPPFFKYYFYLLSGLIVNLLHGFLASRALLIAAMFIIPQFTQAALLATNIVMTVLYGFAYYLYEGYVLKKNLNIPVMNTSTREYLAIYEDQLELLTKINSKISSASFMFGPTVSQYRMLTKVTSQLNELVMMNKKLFSKYKETTAGYIFRQGIIVYGGIMAAGGAFFTMNAALAGFATSLLGTLTGGLLTLGFVGLAVSFYIGQRTHKVYKMMNPQASKFKDLQEQFETIKPRSEKDFSKVIRNKFLYARLTKVNLPTTVTKPFSSIVKYRSLGLFAKSRPAAPTLNGFQRSRSSRVRVSNR
jgi:hypothetical protein